MRLQALANQQPRMIASALAGLILAGLITDSLVPCFAIFFVAFAGLILPHCYPYRLPTRSSSQSIEHSQINQGGRDEIRKDKLQA